MACGVVERYGARPYAFYFSTLLMAPDVPDGRGGFLRVEPREIARSGLHFMNGKVLTLADVEARAEPSSDVLCNNMRWSWPIVCETGNGFRHVAPFKEADVLVDASGAVVERGDTEERRAYRASVLGAASG
jgi:hypothetical protein